MTQPCTQEEFIGRIKEFMESSKGIRASIVTIAIAIIIQVVTFAFLWGQIITTVNNDNKQVWSILTPITYQNKENIDKILAKLDLIKVIVGAQGIQGATGATGARGNDGYSR